MSARRPVRKLLVKWPQRGCEKRAIQIDSELKWIWQRVCERTERSWMIIRFGASRTG